jgi:hypothetical protein
MGLRGGLIFDEADFADWALGDAGFAAAAVFSEAGGAGFFVGFFFMTARPSARESTGPIRSRLFNR